MANTTENRKFISLQKILKDINEDFDKTPASAIKLVRHADNRIGKNSDNGNNSQLLVYGEKIPEGISSMYELYRYHRDLFDKYQSEQHQRTFKNIKYIVVFLGGDSTTARLLGVYEIMNSQQSPYAKDLVLLDLRQVPEFKFMEEKVIIDWGKSTVSWHQYYSQIKEVLRIDEGLTKDNGTPLFKSYMDVILNYEQLNLVLEDDEWKDKLTALNCIYLITDKSNGKCYVGSTYNNKGIYGRWSEYAKTGHGGNVMLKELIKKNPIYHKQYFQWSILKTLPLEITKPEAIEQETIWKKKLLTLIHGYNEN